MPHCEKWRLPILKMRDAQEKGLASLDINMLAAASNDIQLISQRCLRTAHSSSNKHLVTSYHQMTTDKWSAISAMLFKLLGDI